MQDLAGRHEAGRSWVDMEERRVRRGKSRRQFNLQTAFPVLPYQLQAVVLEPVYKILSWTQYHICCANTKLGTL